MGAQGNNEEPFIMNQSLHGVTAHLQIVHWYKPLLFSTTLHLVPKTQQCPLTSIFLGHGRAP